MNYLRRAPALTRRLFVDNVPFWEIAKGVTDFTWKYGCVIGLAPPTEQGRRFINATILLRWSFSIAKV